MERDSLPPFFRGKTIRTPAPTASPVTLAFGCVLIFTGLVTSASVSVLGAVIAVAGAVTWFRSVLPEETDESVPIWEGKPVIVTTHRDVMRVETGHVLPRAWLPLEIYPISAGIKGGLAGSVAMAILAMLYGVTSGKSIWYPINLLVAGFFPGSLFQTQSDISAYHSAALGIATAVHLTTSLLIGLLYGVMLPMFPRRPILLGGFIAPLMWSGLIYTTLGIINPVMNQFISWPWFVVSQFAFGITAGVIVSRQERIRTWQQAPFAVRAGFETAGMMEEHRPE